MKDILNKWFDYHKGWLRVGRYWFGIYRYRPIIIPVIQGGTAANFVQNDKYAFGDDDGSESGHTLDSENTNRTAQVADVTFMIRIQCEETAGGNATYTHALFAQKNGTGGFTEVTTARSDGLKIANDTQSRADDENTTQRLTYGGAGAWQAGKYDDGQTQQGTTSFKCDTEYTELEFAIQIDSANASNGDYWELRCEQSDGTDYNGYPGSYPTVTASISVTPEIDLSDGLTLGESTSITPLVLADVIESDGITIGDTLIDLQVEGGIEPDRDISESDGITIGDTPFIDPIAISQSISDSLTLGESVTVSPLVLADVSISDGMTLGESVDVSVTTPGIPISLDLGVDNLSAWKQGVVIYN